jgi:hypothetical protein
VLGERKKEVPECREHIHSYAPEYRRRIVELARAGRHIDELAHEFEPLANAIPQWVKQAALDEGLRSCGLNHDRARGTQRLCREMKLFKASTSAKQRHRPAGANRLRSSATTDIRSPRLRSTRSLSTPSRPRAAAVRKHH